MRAVHAPGGVACLDVGFRRLWCRVQGSLGLGLGTVKERDPFVLRGRLKRVVDLVFGLLLEILSMPDALLFNLCDRVRVVCVCV